MTKKEETKKVVPQRKSVHVVFFSCENCGEEVEYIQFCPDCGKPMRVIDVVEKFGEDAEGFIKKVEDRLSNGSSKENNNIEVEEEEEEVSNVIVLGEDEHIEEIPEVEEVDSLGEIFPDDDSDSDVKPISSDDDLSDLDDIVAELDKEDDDFSMDDFGDDGLPEL
ncbi:MAG TPA: hypothetical protein PKH06_01875 [Candidatus Dojkabacteria bacterium]|nr:hypothetical protein [Candidatus Dojkabacteria bacterium]